MSVNIELIKEYAMKAEEFLVEQTPLVAQEIVNVKMVGCTVGIIVCVCMLIACIFMIKKFKENAKRAILYDEITMGVLITLGSYVGVVLSFIILICNIYNLLLCVFAPRIVIIEQLVRWAK